MNEDWRCEHTTRKCRKSQPERCYNRWNATVTRQSGETKRVCGGCRNLVTTGRDRTPTDQWS